MTDVRDVVEAYDLMMRSAPRAARSTSVRDAHGESATADELLHGACAIRVRQDSERMRPSDARSCRATRPDPLGTGLGSANQVEQMLSDTLEWWRVQTARGR